MKGLMDVMNNNYEITKLIENGLSIDFYCSFSKEKLKKILDDYFNEIEICLSDFAKTFKILMKGKDYDEYSYQAKALIETLNDIKIILNILDDISKNE